MIPGDIIFSNNAGDLIPVLKTFKAVFVVADKKVRRFVAEPLLEQMAEAGVALRGAFYIKASERRKNLSTVEKIHRWLIGVGADRDALVLAVGGGITTDLAGFAAATYKRGVKYANVPTTLLAMVDASVGGKTGCNVGAYKNMCGAFQLPEFTFIQTDFIRTLPWREFSAGYAELVKTFIIGDAQAYEEAVSKREFDDMLPLIRKAVGIKKGIVERDFRESGERRLLNLGHTFAHAIEAESARCLLRRAIPGEDSFFGLTCRRISHGHAVSIGMVMAAALSEKEGVALPLEENDGAAAGSGSVASCGLAAKIAADLSGMGLPVKCRWSEETLRKIILTDKKAVGGKVNYVLIREIGRCETKVL